MASVFTCNIFRRDSGITILGSQLTGLTRLSCNRKVDLCCVYLKVPRSLQSEPAGSCNQALSFIARFLALPLDLTDFSKPPEPTHPKSQPPQTSSYLLLHSKWTFPYPRSIHLIWTEILTTFKISTKYMFLTIDKIFHNHHVISTDCNYTISCYFMSNSVSLINKLQPFSY